MANLITVFWRDIPAQIIAKERRTNAKIELSPRFADAIDRAAMRSGKGDTDAYLEEWHRVSEPCGSDLQKIANEAAAKIELAYDKDRLLALIKNEGKEPEIL
jgi:hypothetical protein